ncbi:thiamine pyrophosphate-binding protein [uncultured Draconibacterium sp.]|uniref:thiamine pyrophosphate-binding protein n=1 Tax=uncultured Draconibacterium sp. TaxID=1573823 RepID=UPI0025FBCB93|nr:thiamine pyrophosphate-binding protein [uncultured Draconibacterium sp.]
MSTVAQVFAHTLKKIGVTFVFGVPSGNMIDYIEAIRKEEGIEFVLVGHEATAAFMAGVCGKLTGVPGVCFATFGPGATNLSTGVGGAQLDRFPLLAFTDEMPDKLLARTVQMNINQQQLFFPITKWTTRLNQHNLEEIILKGAGIASDKTPGAVHIGIPAGIGQNPVPKTKSEVDYLRLEKKRWAPLLAEQLAKVEKLIQTSKKPVLAVGLSAVHAQVGEQLVALSQKFQVPVVLTPMAKGLFPEDHPLYAGVLFHALSDAVAEVYGQADLVIGIGYDPVEFNYEDWMPEVPLIHIDCIEADVASGQIREVCNVLGALDVALNELLQLEIEPKHWDVKFVQENKRQIFEKLRPEPDCFGPLAVVNELRKILPDEGILTVDVGAHLHLVGQLWRTPKPENLLMTNGWSSMGFAIPAALAAKLCKPDLPVVALMGDGGFAMMAGELASAKRLKLKIVFVVIYDNSLSLIRIKQQKKGFNAAYGTDLEIRTEQATNHYFGVPVIRAMNKTAYVNALNEAFNQNGPVVIEAVVDGQAYDELLLCANKKF